MTHTPKSALTPAFFTILFILPIIAIHAVDLDGGINLRNATAIEKTESGGDAELDQLDSAALWFDASSASGEGRILSLSGQGSYEYADDREYLFNIDHLKTSAWMPGTLGNNAVLELDAGRFLFADPSAFIVKHVADGLRFRMLKPGMSFELSGAYTGLILNPKSDIRMTGTDRADENDEDNTFFGPRRAFAGATLSFPNAGRYENVSVYAYGQFDLREGDDDIEIDTQYLGISTTKLHGSSLYGDFFFNAEFGQIRNPVEDTRNIAGFLLGMGLRWYRENLKSSRLAFRVLAAPPDYATDMIEGVTVASAGYLPVSETGPCRLRNARAQRARDGRGPLFAPTLRRFRERHGGAVLPRTFGARLFPNLDGWGHLDRDRSRLGFVLSRHRARGKPRVARAFPILASASTVRYSSRAAQRSRVWTVYGPAVSTSP